mmetsp:Transcript_9636/g.22484  ORF Transcript_9636/g.22484 Transcript_9636/m.22484 type:complete len:205 (-) Transcript_9636:626-1240(-)
MLPQGLGHDVHDLPARIQRRVRVLKDHLHAAAQGRRTRTGQGLDDVLTVEAHLSLGGTVEADQQPRHRALAAAAFAHQRQRPATLDRKGDAVHRMHQGLGLALDNAVQPGRRHVKDLGKALDLDEGRGHCRPSGNTGFQQDTDVAPTEVSSGRSVRQRSPTRGQRGLKAQPAGMAVRRGIAPSICSRRSRSSSIAGIEPIKPTV